jgi:hypothetical protein
LFSVGIISKIKIPNKSKSVDVPVRVNIEASPAAPVLGVVESVAFGPVRGERLGERPEAVAMEGEIMPFYSQEEVAGMRWITDECQRIAQQMGVTYERIGWEEFVFFVQCVGDDEKRGVEFSHAEVQDCGHAVALDVRKHVSSLISQVLRGQVPVVVKLYERRALTRSPGSIASRTSSQLG